jgi:hypothetical protein
VVKASGGQVKEAELGWDSHQRVLRQDSYGVSDQSGMRQP